MITYHLTPPERALMEAIADVFVHFCALPQQHNSDVPELAALIHRIQDMVAARPAYRQIQLESQLRAWQAEADAHRKANGHGS